MGLMYNLLSTALTSLHLLPGVVPVTAWIITPDSFTQPSGLSGYSMNHPTGCAY
ncbi:hypothetical protein BDW60DRAFT_180497 [Aspergillus nidulans var. acristatus]